MPGCTVLDPVTLLLGEVRRGNGVTGACGGSEREWKQMDIMDRPFALEHNESIRVDLKPTVTVAPTVPLENILGEIGRGVCEGG